jgi:DNA polymerase III delta subunit
MIILISGDDPAQLYREVERQKKQLNIEHPLRIQGNTDNLTDVLDNLFTIPMFGTEQLLIIEGPIESETLDKIADKIGTLPESSLLIISYPVVLSNSDKIIKALESVKHQHIPTKKRGTDTIFIFLENLVKGDLAETLKANDTLEQENVEPYYVLSMCIWQYRQILYALLNTNSFKKSHPYVQQKIRAITPRYNTEKVYKILNFLINCDDEPKNGKLNKESLVLYLVSTIYEYQNLPQINTSG